MRKTFLALVAITTAVGPIAATAASAQRGAHSGRARPLSCLPLTERVAGPYDDFGSCEWVTQRFWDGHDWRARRVQRLRLIRDCGEIERLIATLDSRAETVEMTGTATRRRRQQ